MRVKPPALRDGATVAVVAPSSPPQTRSEIEQATAYFESRGYTLVFGPNHRNVHGYLAGTDAERAADIQWALSEPGIDMVRCLDGGYGAGRLYKHIDWDALGDPRIFCGYSDITALHLALAKHGDWVTFYSPTFLRFTRKKDELTEITEQTSTAPSGPSRSAACPRIPTTRTCSPSARAWPRRRSSAAA